MSAPRATRRIAAFAGFALAVVFALWLMAAISGWVTRGRLVHDARQRLTALHEGQPLWQWRLRQASDLVAGRVFGQAETASAPGALSLRSRDGSRFELGLPVTGPIDAAHWPLLQLDVQSSSAGTVGLSYQASTTSPSCTATSMIDVAPGGRTVSVDLRRLSWQTAAGVACPAPGVIDYMLRLSAQWPPGSTVMIGDIALVAFPPPAMGAAIKANDSGMLWSSVRENRPPSPTPIIRLPAGASAETLLTLRDQALQRWPGAVIVPYGAAINAAHDPRPWAWLDWSLCGAYLAWLVWLLWRQRPGLIRPWVEAAAIAAGPLWLIAGLRWGPPLSLPGITAFLAAIAYGGCSEWRRRPTPWAWRGQTWADWLWPLLPLPVALGLMLADGHGLVHLAPRHVLAYFGWALLQQWAMLAIVMGRLRHTRLPVPVIILFIAGLFGLLHTPNGSLMQLCLLAELWWAWCFIRSPRLVPIAVAHALSALLVESGLTGHLLRSLEVSARFFL